jgi:hypothetical protein
VLNQLFLTQIVNSITVEVHRSSDRVDEKEVRFSILYC